MQGNPVRQAFDPYVCMWPRCTGSVCTDAEFADSSGICCVCEAGTSGVPCTPLYDDGYNDCAVGGPTSLYQGGSVTLCGSDAVCVDGVRMAHGVGEYSCACPAGVASSAVVVKPIVSSENPTCGTSQLNSDKGWCAATAGDGASLQIDIGAVVEVRGILTQGRQDAAQWVTEYKVQTRSDGASSWTDVDGGRVLAGNVDSTSTVVQRFVQPVQARFFRVQVTKFSAWPSMRAGLLVAADDHIPMEQPAGLGVTPGAPRAGAWWKNGGFSTRKCTYGTSGGGCCAMHIVAQTLCC